MSYVFNHDYLDSGARLGSYRYWPNSLINVHELVSAGFFYTGQSDLVKCHICGGGIFGWRKGDCPFQAHSKNFPKCRYIQIQY